MVTTLETNTHLYRKEYLRNFKDAHSEHAEHKMMVEVKRYLTECGALLHKFNA